MTLAVKHDDGAAVRMHVPVMAGEVRELLCARGPRVVVDATVGTGGHALEMLKATSARLVGIDRDADALAVARDRLSAFGDRVTLLHGNFGEIARLLGECGIESADAILADLGMSSFALDDAERGFSFRSEGPLDMRMDRSQKLRAYDLVNEESEADLADILHHLGEEPEARRRSASRDPHLPGLAHRGQPRDGKPGIVPGSGAGASFAGRADGGNRVSFARRPRGKGANEGAGGGRRLRRAHAQGAEAGGLGNSFESARAQRAP